MKILKFEAEWCTPCKALKPVLEQIEKDFQEVAIETIDVDKSPDIATRYSISSLPTMLLIENNKIIDTITGTINYHNLKGRIESALQYGSLS